MLKKYVCLVVLVLAGALVTSCSKSEAEIEKEAIAACTVWIGGSKMWLCPQPTDANYNPDFEKYKPKN